MYKSLTRTHKQKNQQLGNQEDALLKELRDKLEKSDLNNTSRVTLGYKEHNDDLRWEDHLAEIINYQGSTGCVAIVNDQDSKELIVLDNKGYLLRDASKSVKDFLSALKDDTKKKEDLKELLLNICNDAIKHDLVLNRELNQINESSEVLIDDILDKFDTHKHKNELECLKSNNQKLSDYLAKAHKQYFKFIPEYMREQNKTETDDATYQKILRLYKDTDTNQSKDLNDFREAMDTPAGKVFRTAVDCQRKMQQYVDLSDHKLNLLDELHKDKLKALKQYEVKYLNDPNKEYSWNKRDVHPDVKAIEYLRDEGKLAKPQVYYIGLTMPPCVPCDISIRVINKENEGKGQIAARQTDGRYFPNWSRFAYLEDNPKNHKSFKNFQIELKQCIKNPQRYFYKPRPSFQDLKSMQAVQQEVERERNKVPALTDDERDKSKVTVIGKVQPPIVKSVDSELDSDVMNQEAKQTQKRYIKNQKKKTKKSSPQYLEKLRMELEDNKMQLAQHAKCITTLQGTNKELHESIIKCNNELLQARNELQGEYKKLKNEEILLKNNTIYLEYEHLQTNNSKQRKQWIMEHGSGKSKENIEKSIQTHKNTTQALKKSIECYQNYIDYITNDHNNNNKLYKENIQAIEQLQRNITQTEKSITKIEDQIKTLVGKNNSSDIQQQCNTEATIDPNEKPDRGGGKKSDSHINTTTTSPATSQNKQSNSVQHTTPENQGSNKHRTEQTQIDHIDKFKLPSDQTNPLKAKADSQQQDEARNTITNSSKTQIADISNTLKICGVSEVTLGDSSKIKSPSTTPNNQSKSQEQER